MSNLKSVEKLPTEEEFIYAMKLRPRKNAKSDSPLYFQPVGGIIEIINELAGM